MFNKANSLATHQGPANSLSKQCLFLAKNDFVLSAKLTSKKMWLNIALTALLFSGSALSQVSPSNMVVVVSKHSAINKLEDKQVANIFLTRVNYFPNGKRAMPVELNNKHYRKYFYEGISGKTATELMAYWTRLIFLGKGHPPKAYGNMQSLIHYLESNPRSISYMPLAQLTNDLKVVYRFPYVF